MCQKALAKARRLDRMQNQPTLSHAMDDSPPLAARPVQDALAVALAREFFLRTSTSAPIGVLGIVAVLYPHWDAVAHSQLLLWAALMALPLAASTVYGRWALGALQRGARPQLLVHGECALAALAGAMWGLMPLMADTGAQDSLFYYRLMVLCIAIVFVIPALAHFVRVWVAFAGAMWLLALAGLMQMPYTTSAKLALAISIGVYWLMALGMALMDKRRTLAALADNLAVKQLSESLTQREKLLQDRVSAQTAELTRTVESLREQEALLSNSQQLARVGYFVYDPKNQRFRTSEVLNQILGLGPNEPRTLQNWIARVHPEQRERVSQIIDERHRGEGPTEVTYRIVRATDNADRWVRSRSQMVMDANGKLTTWFGNIQDITEQKEAEDKIHALAFYDPLTQLANRRLLQDRLEQALLASQRSQNHGALMMLDLDNFKTINDTRGHALGDQLLVEVAQRISASLRGMDSVARTGGDEFVVMVENLGQDAHQAARQAELVAEKVRIALCLPYQLDGRQFHSSTSIGITLFCTQESDFPALMRQADLALYQAKDAGRNAIRFYEATMQEAVEHKASREDGLREAVARQELTLYYQPQVDQYGRITGAEALVRWITASGTFISPGEFIPLAEESDLILHIGAWVLETGCAQLKRWQSQPATAQLKLAINVSARQFRDPLFEAQVQDAIARHGIAPSGLKLELTESMVLDDISHVVERMHALRRLGLSFALDDFGTGYSSLSYLRQLPLDQLKIDQSFVRDLASGTQGSAILKAIIDMGTSLQLEIIAEGVETEEQRQFLTQSGCALFQGYLFYRPVPIDKFPVIADH